MAISQSIFYEATDLSGFEFLVFQLLIFSEGLRLFVSRL